jgi:hypothetical protein
MTDAALSPGDMIRVIHGPLANFAGIVRAVDQPRALAKLTADKPLPSWLEETADDAVGTAYPEGRRGGACQFDRKRCKRGKHKLADCHDHNRWPEALQRRVKANLFSKAPQNE